MDTLDLLLHPVRLRLVFALAGGRVRTTAELSAALPDVPKTTVYRHVRLLAEAGVLEVAEERKVRAVAERYYRLREARVTVDDETAASMSPDEHRRAFAVGMAAVHAEFNAYLNRAGARPYDDRIGYRQGVLWLDDDELTGLLDDLRAVFAARAGNRPRPGRRRRLMNLIQFPVNDDPADPTPSGAQ